MADVSEAELAVLQKAYGLLNGLAANPKAKTLLEQAVKEADPKYKTTTEQAREVLAPELADLTSKVDALAKAREDEDEARKAREEADAKVRLDLAFDALRRDGATDEGIEATQRLMLDRNIADPMAAWALFQKQNPVVEVKSASYEPQAWNYEDNAVQTDVKGLWADEERWADQETGRILTDMRKAPDQG